MLDKLGKYLSELPQVVELHPLAREAKLRTAIGFIQSELKALDVNNNGNVEAGRLIVLLNFTLKALTNPEALLLAEYLIE